MSKTSISQRILKSMALFGGVRIISILCSIIRTKFVALWLGPAGVGLFVLYYSAVEMMSSFTNLGIRESSVRDIASAKSSNAIAITVKVVRSWSKFLGIAGALLFLALSPLLSKISFYDLNHTWGFAALSVVILLNSLILGEEAILQGTAKLRQLARASIGGVVAGLIVSLPMFYFWRLDSVIPSLIAYQCTTAFFMWHWRNKDYRNEPVRTTPKDTFNKGKEFVKLGTFMMLSQFVAYLCAYIYRAWLNTSYTTEDVGFFQAGFAIGSQYTGIIFAAMGVEYYPRLARVIKSNRRTGLFVSKQANLLLTLIIPMLSAFILLAKPIISILYSEEFTVVVPYVTIAMLGIVFRAMSWAMAFTILAKGDGRTYLLTECVSAAVGLALKILLYDSLGIAGLGIAFTAWYAVYVSIITYIYKVRYQLQLHKSSIWLSITALATVATSLMLHFNGIIWGEITMVILTSIFSLRLLKRSIFKS